jgi:hypothetical protein
MMPSTTSCKVPGYVALCLFLCLNVLWMLHHSSHNSLPNIAESIVDIPKLSRSTELLYERNASAQSSSNSKGRAVQILSTVPWDDRHVVALWSELECWSKDVDDIVISAPKWSLDIIHSVVSEARKRIPHLSPNATEKISIETEFHVNDRYDVGLWCDALQGVLKKGHSYENIVLLNDSVFALREFRGVLDAIRSSDGRVSMASLSYSRLGGDWLESVFRAFSRDALDTFMNHSCVPSNHESFCPKRKSAQKRKRCIVEHHEIGMAGKFRPDQVLGLYPSDVPKEMWTTRPNVTWVVHVPYWRNVLVERMGFPAAKVGMKDMIESIRDPLLQNCTRHFDWRLLDKLDFDSRGNSSLVR